MQNSFSIQQLWREEKAMWEYLCWKKNNTNVTSFSSIHPMASYYRFEKKYKFLISISSDKSTFVLANIHTWKKIKTKRGGSSALDLRYTLQFQVSSRKQRLEKYIT
jgi:hypothetical protein